MYGEPIVSEAEAAHPLSSEYGTYKTVTAIFWPWFRVECGTYKIAKANFGKLASALRTKSLKHFEVFPLRAEADLGGTEGAPGVGIFTTIQTIIIIIINFLFITLTCKP